MSWSGRVVFSGTLNKGDTNKLKEFLENWFNNVELDKYYNEIYCDEIGTFNYSFIDDFKEAFTKFKKENEIDGDFELIVYYFDEPDEEYKL